MGLYGNILYDPYNMEHIICFFSNSDAYDMVLTLAQNAMFAYITDQSFFAQINLEMDSESF